MWKMKLLGMIITGLLFVSTLAWAAPPQDYMLESTFKNSDGQVFRIIKYYLRDGSQFRVDYLSADGTANTVEIYSKDKGLLWTIDPSFKNYSEVTLDQEAWERTVTGVFATEAHKLKKTGTMKFLNYTCDLYEAEKNGWTTVSLVEPGTNIILRSEIKEKDKTVQIMETTELRFEKPAASFFEIPAGYQRSE